MDTPARPATIPVGTLVAGRYRIKERLGQGSSGVVYRARHEDLRRDYALKLLNPEVELLRGRRGTTSFRHRFAVPLREAGRDRELGLRYLVMDIVEGRSLADLLSGHALRPESAVRLARQVLEVVEYAHRAGLVHRDLKPGKILLTEVEKGKEEVRVLGFGLAEAINPESMGGDADEVLRRAEVLRQKVLRRDPRLVTKTRLKPIVQATPGKKTDFEDLTYMSPELLLGRSYDGRADIYAVGAILYEALSRRRPFEADSRALDPIEDLKQQIEGHMPRHLSEVAPRVPAGLAEEVMRALSKAPFDRHESAASFRRAIRKGLERVALKDPSVTSEVGEQVKVTAVARTKPDAPPEEPARPQVKISLPEGTRCPSCHKLLTDAGSVRCVACRAPHHAHCFRVDFACAKCGHEEYDGEGTIRVEPRAHGLRRALLLKVFLPLAVASALVVAGLMAFQRGLFPSWASGKEGRFLGLRGYTETAPRWFERLGEVGRPPYLPDGVGYGKAQGEYINKKDGTVLVWVPQGELHAGPPDDREVVRFTRGFFIGKYELTWAQYEAFCAETGRVVPSRLPTEGLPPYPVGPDHPVFNVTHEEAEDYAAWAGLRLPTQHEWEYAARGAGDREYPWGDTTPTRAHGLIEDMNFRHKTHPVGDAEGASPFGCADMYGNVREWSAGLAPNKMGIVTSGPHPVHHRLEVSPDHRSETIGFRLARSLPERE